MMSETIPLFEASPVWAYPHMKEKKERKEKERMDEVEIKIEHKHYS